MTEKRDISSNIDRAMESLDGMQRATPRPFFFTRLKAQMTREETSTWERVTAFISRPMVAVVSLFLIAFLNGGAFYYLSSLQTKAGSETLEPTYVEDYNANTGNFYYDENSTPDESIKK